MVNKFNLRCVESRLAWFLPHVVSLHCGGFSRQVPLGLDRSRGPASSEDRWKIASPSFSRQGIWFDVCRIRFTNGNAGRKYIPLLRDKNGYQPMPLRQVQIMNRPQEGCI